MSSQLPAPTTQHDPTAPLPITQVRQRYTPTMKANRMNYTDGDGKACDIHIPGVRYEEAMDMFRKEDWEGLRGFEGWAGQPYLESEIVMVKNEDWAGFETAKAT